MMSNAQINRQLRGFDETRRKWVEILVNDPGHTQAAVHIININAKMEVFRLMWNWSDETEEMAVIR
jgi:hypothetical protein